jgi:hypothetical protein
MPDCHNVSSRPGRTRVAAAGLVLLAVLWPVLGWPVLGGDPARAAAGSDRLLPGETLQAGQWISAGRDTLAMQGDGNLVLYAPGSTPVWATGTAGHDGAQLVMQTDGNLVLAVPGGRPLWAAGTSGHGGAVLILQPDGDVVIDAPGSVVLWSTNTSKQTYAVVQLPAHGRGPDQFGCLNSIWVRESGWNERAGHPASAYGIPQADPVRHPVPGLGLRAGPQALRAAASRCSWG